MAVQQKRRSWTAYTTPIFVALSIITLAVLVLYRRSMAGLFTDLKSGSSAGLALAYAGSLLLVAAQFYTIVKRSGWIGLMKKMGGARPWLTIHIALSFIGLIAVLIHAGFPYRFRYDVLFDHGLAGLTTWLLIASSVSGVFGRYIYRKLPAMRKAFGYWKPAHLLVTGLLFFAATYHMLTAFGG